MSTKTVSVGVVQMACSDAAIINVARAMDCIREAADAGAQIICLPELFRSRYFCQREDPAHFALSEPIPGPTTEVLSNLAANLGVVVIASLFEQRAPGIYHNTAAVIDADGSYLGKYRKMHIPDDPQFYEKFYFTPGDLGFKVFQTRYAKIGVLICWDQWFPEAARLTALRGAEILFYPTAIGWLPPEKETHGDAQYAGWETVHCAHAITNGCYVVSVNRTGFEPVTEESTEGIEFWGQSLMVDPQGQLLLRAAVDSEEVIVEECDLTQIEVLRTTWPFLRDRRIDAYGDLTQRYLDD